MRVSSCCRAIAASVILCLASVANAQGFVQSCPNCPGGVCPIPAKVIAAPVTAPVFTAPYIEQSCQSCVVHESVKPRRVGPVRAIIRFILGR